MAKILLVEDDNNLREIYGARLMAEGFTIVAAADGEEALAMAVKEKPDLIISDVMMPKISGFDMLDILRTTAETKNTKVIMMTALSQPEDRERGEKLGADRYLVKSQVTLEDVVAVVHEVLEDGAGTPAAEPAPTVVNPDAANPAVTPASTTPPEPAAAQTPPAPAAAPIAAPTAPDPKPTPEPVVPAEPAADAPPAVVKLDSDEKVTDDTPEPASKKKKVIEPITDLSKEPDIQKLAQEEEATENERTPGAAIPPSLGNKPDIAETIAQEKEEMEEQIQEFVDKTAVDAPEEASAETTAPETVADAPAVDPPTAPESTVEPSAPNPAPAADPNAPNPNDIAL